MLQLFGSRKERRAHKRPATRLHLECLEGRINPTPVLSNISAHYVNNQMVLTGQLQDDSLANNTIQISGAATGRTTTDASGNFTFTAGENTLGQLTIVGVDANSQTSDAYYLNVQAPPIVYLSIMSTHQTNVTLQGSVVAPNPAGFVVQIFGVCSSSVVTDANGQFSITLPASSLGSIYADTTDSLGQVSNIAVANLQFAPPTFGDVGYWEQPGNFLTIAGHVDVHDPQGMQVTLGGDIPALRGLTATLDANGNFQITVQVPNDQGQGAGVVSFTVTDWWGQTATIDRTIWRTN
jgi:hypothetical protein